jgi:hypothetical protein
MRGTNRRCCGAYTCGSTVDYAARVHDDRAPTDADLDELHDEAAMWRSETRGDRSSMDRRLARHSAEFGRSGRRYARAEVLAVVVGEIHATLTLRDLQCRRLGGSVVLVTYQSEVDGLLANRSSIWRFTDAGWQMEFHQGTPTTAR